jgi:hypothetical protein
MELLDRYLNAVKGYLPEAQQNDIIEELKDSLMSQIEEREAALKRPLTDAELQAFIKQSAHPMLVAGRYLPQQYLIGPEMYPFWWASQRVMLMVTASIYSLLAGIQIVTSGDNFIQSLIQTLFQAFAGFVGTALFYAAVITLVFWLFERNQVRFGFMDRWNPEKLAPVKETLQIKRGDSIFDLVTETLFLRSVLPRPFTTMANLCHSRCRRCGIPTGGAYCSSPQAASPFRLSTSSRPTGRSADCSCGSR